MTNSCSKIAPPGFRFRPTDVELVLFYLKRKMMDLDLGDAISEIDLYNFSPWDLPGRCRLPGREEWHFFCHRNPKYPSGSRNNRCNDVGYWRITGKDKNIYNGTKLVGTKRILVFHLAKGLANVARTDWVMHEYNLKEHLPNSGYSPGAYVVCKVFKKCHKGPKIGEQNEIPFIEEDWENKEFQVPLCHLPVFGKCHEGPKIEQNEISFIDKDWENKEFQMPVCHLSVLHSGTSGPDHWQNCSNGSLELERALLDVATDDTNDASNMQDQTNLELLSANGSTTERHEKRFEEERYSTDNGNDIFSDIQCQVSGPGSPCKLSQHSVNIEGTISQRVTPDNAHLSDIQIPASSHPIESTTEEAPFFDAHNTFEGIEEICSVYNQCSGLVDFDDDDNNDDDDNHGVEYYDDFFEAMFGE